MGTPPQVTARAMRVTFDAARLFPQDDPLSIPLLRLMIAADDARHLQKLMMMAPAIVNQEIKTEAAIFEGEMGHLFRLLCGHLYEAGIVFRGLDSNRKYSARLDTAIAGNDKAKAALERVRQAYRPHDEKDEEQGFWYSFLGPIRNFIGFHYKDEKLRESFGKYQNSEVLSGSLTLVEFSGLGRYTVTDSLVKLVIADALGGDVVNFLGKYPELMKEAIKLAGALAEVVDHLLIHLFDFHQEANPQQDEDVITIPAWLQQDIEETAKGDDGTAW